MRILRLTLKRQWFDEIARGVKKKEYREYKPYWRARLEGREYDAVLFRNGYDADVPEMLVECGGVGRDGTSRKARYVIRLGRVIKIKRWRSRG
jgi:hypothetical protein